MGKHNRCRRTMVHIMRRIVTSGVCMQLQLNGSRKINRRRARSGRRACFRSNVAPRRRCRSMAGKRRIGAFGIEFAWDYCGQEIETHSTKGCDMQKGIFQTPWGPVFRNAGVIEVEGITHGFACRFEGQPAAALETKQGLPIMGRNARSQGSGKGTVVPGTKAFGSLCAERCVTKGILVHAAVLRAAGSMEIRLRKGGLSVKAEDIPRPCAEAVTGMGVCS